VARTELLRRQHDAAVALVEELGAGIRSYRSTEDAYDIALKLTKLKGLLRIHFAHEDRMLYPAMIAGVDRIAAQTALGFQNEMGGLNAAFEAYASKWALSSNIASAFANFRDESADIFGKLANRIERENEDLYPLADQMQEAA